MEISRKIVIAPKNKRKFGQPRILQKNRFKAAPRLEQRGLRVDAATASFIPPLRSPFPFSSCTLAFLVPIPQLEEGLKKSPGIPASATELNQGETFTL